MTVEPEILEDLRERVDGLHPPGSLKDAVLRDLPERRACRGAIGARPRLFLGLGAGLAAAAALIVPTVFRPRGPERDSHPTLATPAPAAPQLIAQARARNQALYERERARLHRDLFGKWVLIADRAPEEVEGAFKPLVVGETLESVASLAADAKHRFVFRVGEEGDATTPVTAWGGPRFAGRSLLRAMGVPAPLSSTGGSIELRRGDRAMTFRDASPFPRLRVGIEAAAGATPDTPEPREVLPVGDAGPTLLLTPDDDRRLGLARWEVPGTETVGDVPCRRVLVRVSIPELGIVAPVVAAVPDVPPAALVAKARVRNEPWTWSQEMGETLDLGEVPAGETRWLVLGNDRVLGVGSSAEAALSAASAYRDVIYHRYVTPWPRPTKSSWDVVGSLEARVEVGGVAMEARVSSTLFDSFVRPEKGASRRPVLPVFVPWIAEADWVRAGLPLAEDPAELMSDQECPPGSDLRAAYARVQVSARGATPVTREGFVRIVAFVVPREAQRTFLVTKGDTIHVESEPGGGAKITVVIRAGKDGAGSYSSSSPHLREAAADAARTLTDPDTKTEITVDGNGALVSISSTVTKR